MDLQQWVGNTEVLEDHIYPTPARALAATLNLEGFAPEPGVELPPLWYWLYFLPLAPMAEVGSDGHPKRGGFLPPVALERRMWAGSQMTFHAPLRIGDAVEKTSRVVSVEEKSGKAGPLVFVTVQHTLRSPRGLAVEETQNIVYLQMPDKFAPAPPNPLPEDLAWRDAVAVDPVLLFRFSALTFNGHRIHYDRTYAMDVERYPGLVVHGPLQALLLMESARAKFADRTVAAFDFRATRPVFDFDDMSVCGREGDDGSHTLYTANTSGDIAVQARLTWS